MSEPLRVTFVGRASHVGHAVPSAPVEGLEAAFVEYRPGWSTSPLLAHVAERRPDVVAVFGVGTLPRAAVAALGVPAVAWDVAPDEPPGADRHPSLPQFEAAFRAERASAGDYAHVVDEPLPAADELFLAPRPAGGVPRALVIGHSSPRVERMIVDSKHRYDLLHIAGGLRGPALAGVLRGADVAIDVRDDDRPGFGTRVALYVAAGLLLVSEPLRPAGVLRPGVDYLEVTSSEQIVHLLGEIRADPGAFAAIRAAGRERAEALRASRVYPRLLARFSR